MFLSCMTLSLSVAKKVDIGFAQKRIKGLLLLGYLPSRSLLRIYHT